jgi:hypothetical protein
VISRFNDHLGVRLAALVDGELAHDDRDRVLAHLAGCVACRTLVESERALKRDLAAMPMPEPSARLMAALFQIPQAERPADPPSGGRGVGRGDGPGPGQNQQRSPQLGGFLGRSSAFLPEFAVGLRPIGDPPGESYAERDAAELEFRGTAPQDGGMAEFSRIARFGRALA